MKTKVQRQSTKGQKPYDGVRKSNGHENTRIKYPQIDITHGARRFRDFALEAIAANYPGIAPRNDFDIMTMSGTIRAGTKEEIYAWLDEECASSRNELGFDTITPFLDTYMEITGRKPLPGEKGVYTRAIPDSEYSIRLFPGAYGDATYCLDIVRTSSGEPVNSPFPFELWSVPDPARPNGIFIVGRVHSIERNYGVKPGDMRAGAEKFALSDGMVCELRRPGKRPVRFKVPARKREVDVEEADELEFPEEAEE